MGWWRNKKVREERQSQEREASTVAALASAFGTALAGVLAAQTEGIKQQGQFLNTLQDLSARKAAQVLGSKGGRKSAERRKARQKGSAGQPECVLCVNPFHRGTTLEQIAFHRLHEGRVDEPSSLTLGESPETGN